MVTKLANALAVLVLSRKTREWLMANDQTAYRQALRALREYGWSHPTSGATIDQAVEIAQLMPVMGSERHSRKLRAPVED